MLGCGNFQIGDLAHNNIKTTTTTTTKIKQKIKNNFQLLFVIFISSIGIS